MTRIEVVINRQAGAAEECSLSVEDSVDVGKRCGYEVNGIKLNNAINYSKECKQPSQLGDKRE